MHACKSTRLILTVVPVQRQSVVHNGRLLHCSVAALAIEWFLECVPDPFLNLIDSSPVHNLYSRQFHVNYSPITVRVVILLTDRHTVRRTNMGNITPA